MKKLFLIVAATAALGLTAASGLFAQDKPIYPAPGEGWHKAKPEKYGFPKEALNDLTKFLIDSTYATGVTVIVGGEMIYSFGAQDRLSYIASCRKSVLAMMYGKYVENGTINLDETVEELGLDDIGGLLPIEKKARVIDLVTARSGCYHPASNAGDSEEKPARGTKKPGKYFLYNNWDFNVAGAVFEMKTGKNIYDAFQEDIGSQIGLQDWDREAQKKGGNLKVSIYPAYHFYFSVRDMARIGYLMLREGNWDGNQVLSREWVGRIVSPVSSYKEVRKRHSVPRFSYGYMWWLFDDAAPKNTPAFHGGYTARGAMGQYITVLPALDMVVAFKTDAVYKRKTPSSAYFRFLDRLVQIKE